VCIYVCHANRQTRCPLFAPFSVLALGFVRLIPLVRLGVNIFALQYVVHCYGKSVSPSVRYLMSVTFTRCVITAISTAVALGLFERALSLV